jgi:hypothetical protein
MLGDKYVFEVGIYRQTEAAFEAKFERDLAKHIAEIEAAPMPSPVPPSSELQEKMKFAFRHKYPCPWRYNELVGFIRVYVLDDQIRGEKWVIDSMEHGKRYDRRAKKVFRCRHDAFTMLIFEHQDNEALGREIRRHLIEAGKEVREGAFADTEAFDNLSPFIDWRGLIGSVKPRPG